MKSYTDLDQSKKLAEILPIESADMYWDYDVQKHEDYPMVMDEQFDDTCIRAWSLAALFSALPEYIKFDGHTWKFYNDHYGMYYMNADTYDTNTFSTNSENLVDAAFEMIIKLNEQNLL